jgi:hypothetical protein
MRKIREALRLCLAEGLSPTLAGIATGLPRSTVRRYVLRAAEVGLGWPLPPDLDDRALEERLYGRAAPPPAEQRPMPAISAKCATGLPQQHREDEAPASVQANPAHCLPVEFDGKPGHRLINVVSEANVLDLTSTRASRHAKPWSRASLTSAIASAA